MKRWMASTAAAAVALIACTSGGGAGDAESTNSEPTGISSPAQTSSSPTPAASPLWVDATPPAFTEGTTWTNKVDLADIDGDGDVDVLFAEGGDYDTPGEAVPSRVFTNDGSAGFTDVSTEVLGARSAPHG